MKTIKAKRGKISPSQLFFIILVSRAVVALTFFQSILNNGITPDVLLSSFLARILNLLICLPAYFCAKNNKNPLDFKVTKAFYLVYFIFFASVNISRFAFFASSETNEGSGSFLFIILMAGAACYAASLGIEAFSRFSVICADISIVLLIIIIVMNIRNFHITNFAPFFINTKYEIFENSVIFTSNSIEPALFLVLWDKTNSDNAKPFFLGIVAAYFAIFIMLLFCIGVLGSAAPLFSYPVFTLFQMTAYKSFSRLDIVYTAFGFFALFAKCAIIIYCATQTVEKYTLKTKSAALFIILSISSVLITQQFFSEIINNAKIFYFTISVIFSIIIPSLVLIFAKRKGENRIEDS